jgi:hypothetical protein
MLPNAYVNHVPVLTGGVGRDQLKDFYSKHFIPNMPSACKICGRVTDSLWPFCHDFTFRGQLGDVPAPAQCLDQLHTACHLLHVECDRCLLICK